MCLTVTWHRQTQQCRFTLISWWKHNHILTAFQERKIEIKMLMSVSEDGKREMVPHFSSNSKFSTSLSSSLSLPQRLQLRSLRWCRVTLLFPPVSNGHLSTPARGGIRLCSLILRPQVLFICIPRPFFFFAFFFHPSSLQHERWMQQLLQHRRCVRGGFLLPQTRQRCLRRLLLRL